MTINKLTKVLPKAWEKRPNNAPAELLNLSEPSVGQCAVTALIIQDYFGGEIVNAVASDPKYPEVTTSHYFNIVQGKEVDLTRAQFREHVQFSKATPKLKGFRSTREYILSYPSTVERYEKLKTRLEKF